MMGHPQLNLEQAQNEIDALQRRLAEYASENQRLREQGRECYVDADSKSLLNALEECRTERDKLKEGGKQLAKACKKLLSGLHFEALNSCEFQQVFDDAMTAARELGLLEDK
jgi:ribosomal protein S6